MRKLVSFVVLLAVYAIPAFAAPETFTGVSVIDSNCSKKAAADPDSHTRQCALKCQASGYGILTSDQKFSILGNRVAQRFNPQPLVRLEVAESVVIHEILARMSDSHSYAPIVVADVRSDRA